MACFMAINIQNANAYFKGRTVGFQWDEYSTEQKDAAIIQARRDLAMALGRAMKDDEPEYKDGETTRDEYAVYEQAFYSLIRTANPRGSGDVVQALESLETRAIERINTSCGGYSYEALKWLADVVRIRITR